MQRKSLVLTFTLPPSQVCSHFSAACALQYPCQGPRPHRPCAPPREARALVLCSPHAARPRPSAGLRPQSLPAYFLWRGLLGNLPADSDSFPVASWFRECMFSGVQRFALNSLMIRRPSPPSRVGGFLPDGSNLPWVVARLSKENPDRFRAWIEHLKTALPDLLNIATFERPEDKHSYMIYEYTGGLKLPSWSVSDGTLRLTALTLPAYMSNTSSHQSIFLIEEPENGIHPKP